MEKSKSALFAALLLLASNNSYGEVNEYNVEIVIFEDTSDQYLSSEQWPDIDQQESALSIPDFDNTSPLENQSVINIVSTDVNKLNEHVAKLDRSRRHNVLLHKAWRQAGLNENNAVDFKIDTTTPVQNSITHLFTSTDTQNTSDDTSSVQGSIKIILERYLHIHTNLIYKRSNKTYKEISPELTAGKKFSKYEIKSQRRMRSNELHYLDHPLLGILVLVNPVKEQESRNTVQN